MERPGGFRHPPTSYRSRRRVSFLDFLEFISFPRSAGIHILGGFSRGPAVRLVDAPASTSAGRSSGGSITADAGQGFQIHELLVDLGPIPARRPAAGTGCPEGLQAG